jgi:hypothetical protein
LHEHPEFGIDLGHAPPRTLAAGRRFAVFGVRDPLVGFALREFVGGLCTA